MPPVVPEHSRPSHPLPLQMQHLIASVLAAGEQQGWGPAQQVVQMMLEDEPELVISL